MIIDLAEVRRDVIGMTFASMRGDAEGLRELLRPYEQDDVHRAAFIGATAGVIWALAAQLAPCYGMRAEDILRALSLEARP